MVYFVLLQGSVAVKNLRYRFVVECTAEMTNKYTTKRNLWGVFHKKKSLEFNSAY